MTSFMYFALILVFVLFMIVLFVAVKLRQEEKHYKKISSKQLRDSVRREAEYENTKLKRQ